MKIAIDLDRTIFDTDQLIYNIANHYKYKDITNAPTDYKEFFAEGVVKGFDPLFFLKLGDPDSYWEIKGAVDVLKKWKNEGHTIYIISRRPNIKSQQRSAFYWLQKHGVKYDHLILSCKNKPYYCRENGIDLIIDDMIQNCNGCDQLGITSIWLKNKQNAPLETFKRENVITSSSWKEIDSIVDQLEESCL